ncbi:MAG: acyltransferase family protein [Flexilinea sp.]|nr:acyltransferase family protein [Flexilinea sp.]
MVKTKQSRDVSIDLIRIIACFMVVMIHTAAYDFDSGDPGSSQWMAQNVYDSFVRSGVPLFFMLSGAVFLQKKEISLKYVWKKVFRLLIVYILFYVFYKAFEVRHELVRDPLYLFTAIRWGHYPPYHLWFMLELSAIYVMLPFIHRCVSSKPELAKYYLALFFAFSVVKTTVLKIPGFPDESAQYINAFVRVQGLDYMGYFVLGWYLNEKVKCAPDRTGWTMIPLGTVYVVCALVTAFLTRDISIQRGKPDIRWYDNFVIFTFCEAVCLFSLLKIVTKRAAVFFEKEHIRKVISVVSSCSFFVYLIHPFMIDFVEHFKLTPVRYNLWVSIPLFTLLYWAVSMVPALIVRRIPRVNQLF